MIKLVPNHQVKVALHTQTSPQNQIRHPINVEIPASHLSRNTREFPVYPPTLGTEIG